MSQQAAGFVGRSSANSLRRRAGIRCRRWCGMRASDRCSISSAAPLGSPRTPPIEMAMRVLTPLSGAERVTVLGRTERLDLLGAAFINAVGGNLLDYDDTHLRDGHPSHGAGRACRTGAGGATWAVRGGDAARLHPGRRSRVPDRQRRFARALRARLAYHLDLRCLRLRRGEREAAGPGRGSRHGTRWVSPPASPPDWSRICPVRRRTSVSATLPATGCSPHCWPSRATPRRPPRSRARSAGRVRWATIRRLRRRPDGLGEHWEVLKNTYKPYPCGIVMHAVIDACLALRRDHAVMAAEIAEIIVSGDQLLLDRGDRTVTNERDARVSIHHCAAVSLPVRSGGIEGVLGRNGARSRGRCITRIDEGAVECRQPPRGGDREGPHRRW